MKTYIDYCPSAPVSINAELITVPSGPPYIVETEHNWIVNDSSIEIWENDDKSGTHLVEEAYDGSVSGSGKFQVDYLGASEGDAKYCNKIFFHADQGGLSFYVWYKTEGDVFGADDANSKALKDSDAVAGNLAKFDADGNPVDSGSSATNLADAVNKKHTQNTDQYLDQGGANQVAVADVKDAVTKKHSHSNLPLLETYTQTETNLADAVSKKHTQGTDTTLGTMTADINMNSHKITNVTDPSSAQDAATKNYVDTHGIALDQVVLGSQIFG